jgi:hypothetical protein
MHERLIPTILSGCGTVAGAVTAATYDINLGGLVAGVGGLSMAFGAGWYSISSAKTKAYRESEAAKLEVYKSRMAAELEAKREMDGFLKGSATGKLDALQVSMDEAKEVASDRAEIIVELRHRVEDANVKLHDLLNEANAKNLEHQAEKMHLQAELEAANEQLRQANDRLKDIQAQNVHLSEMVGTKLADTIAVVAQNKEGVQLIRDDLAELRHEAHP